MDARERMNDPEEAQRAALDGRQAEIRTAFPGIVAAVDLAANTCSVQPATQGEVTGPDGSAQLVNLPLLVDVPICWPRGGGFVITFPLKVGDEVLVVIADRCIDGWWSSGAVSAPIQFRMHDLSDGFAIPGGSSQPKRVTAVSATSLQMRNEAGSAYIELTASGDINLVARNITQTATAAATTTAQAVAITQTGGGAVPFNTGSGGIDFTGGAVRNNGKNIGGTHTHTAQGANATTTVPN